MCSHLLTDKNMDKILKEKWFNIRRSHKKLDEPYKHYERRLASFNHPNWPTDVPVSVDELARNGFYYVGTDDCVSCAWCRGYLRNWTPGDTALNEHRRHFPDCDFVKQRIGCAHEQTAALTVDEPSLQRKSLNEWRQQNAIETIRAMELYSDSLIDNAVHRLLQHSSVFDSVTLLDMIFDLEPSVDCCCKEKSVDAAVETVTDMHKLMNENEILKSNITCKVCLDKPINTLFIPCRHLMCCKECADCVRNCPFCRRVIVGTVDVFM